MIEDESPKSTAGKSLLLLTAVFFVLVCLPAVASGQEKEKPLAADLVEDGQLIDIASPRYQKLFSELEEKHHFNKQEMGALFDGVAILKDRWN